MQKIFTEENGVYQIDLTNTVEAVENLKEKYQTIGNFLSDVDFIAETENDVFLIEYKNTDVENANNPQAFKEKIDNGKLYNNIISKFYGSAYYIFACKKEKAINYIFIIESTYVDSVWRKKACASIKKRLPIELQKLSDIKVNLIHDFKVLSIQEWNEQYSMFPLTKIENRKQK